MPDESNTPPIGNHQQAEKYLSQLIESLRRQQFPLTHSDLSKFEPCSFQDHYRIDLGQFHAEISHSKHPQSGADVYSLIFTSIDKIRSGQSNQAILSYIPLTGEQFSRFKSTAEAYFAEQKRLAEEKRFKAAMQPIDSLLKTDQPDNSKSNNSEHHHTELPNNRDNRDSRDSASWRTSNPDNRDTPPKSEPVDDSQFFHQFSLNSNPVAEYTPPQDFPKN